MAEIEEVELDGTGASTPPSAAAPRRRRPRQHRWTWVLVAVALVGAGALLAPPGGVLIDGHTGGVELGVIDRDLRDAPQEIWRTGLTTTLEGRDVLQVAGEVLVTTGPEAVAGHDLTDGSLLWRAEGTDLHCSRHTVLVCVNRSGAPDAEVVRIDLREGEESRSPLPRAWAAIDVGEDLVAFVARHPDPGLLVRIGPDGTVAWDADAWTSPAEGEPFTGRMEVVGDQLQVDGNAVDLASGVLERASEGWFPYDDRTQLRVVEDADGRGLFDVSRDGTVVATGQHVLMQADDDLGGRIDVRTTLPGVASPAVSAVRSDTGQMLWSVAEEAYPVARLDGVLTWSRTQGQDSVLEARDLRTGALSWTADVGTRVVGGGGETLLVHDSLGRLLGVDVRTGRERWAADLDAFLGTQVGTATGMVVVDGDDLVLLDWPG